MELCTLFSKENSTLDSSSTGTLVDGKHGGTLLTDVSLGTTTENMSYSTIPLSKSLVERSHLTSGETANKHHVQSRQNSNDKSILNTTIMIHFHSADIT